MKSKKVTMLAAALVVAVVAAAGIGYAAATTYTAETSNANNQLDTKYFIIKESGGNFAYGDILTNLTYNTTNSSGTITYVPNFTHTITDDVATPVETGGTYALISQQDLVLEFDMSKTTDSLVNLVVTVDNFTEITGLKYTMLLNGATGSSANEGESLVYNSQTHTGTWTFNGLTLTQGASTTFKVTIFISLDNVQSIASNDLISTAGFGSGQNLSKITFVATAGISSS